MTVSRGTAVLMAAALAAAFAGQLVIDCSATNIFCACVVVASSLAVLLYIQCTDAIERQPVSTFAILGFCVTTQYGALLAVSGTGTSLTASLREPVQTFMTLAGYQAIAMAVHAAYRLFTRRPHKHSAARQVLERIGVYAVPSARQLWIMGLIGCISYVLMGGKVDGAGKASGGLLSSVAVAFTFLACAPFLIPLYIRSQGSSYCDTRRATLGLLLYFLFVLLLALARNIRVIMFVGVATFGLICLLICLRSNSRIAPGSVPKVAMLALVLAALAAPLSDLATAMAIVRGGRGKLPASEMIRSTLDVWRKPYLIDHYRNKERSAELYAAYDESYIPNPVFARFIETKFHDNALYFGGKIVTAEGKRKLAETSGKFILSLAPTPLLRLIGANIDKRTLNFSMGDYLVYLSRGLPLGGRKTGSVFGQGWALCGPLFPFVYASICLALFGWMDLLTVRGAGAAMPAPVALMNSWPLFLYGITGESLHFMLSDILRTFPQMVCVYVLVRAMTRAFAGREEAAAPEFAGPAARAST